MKLQVIALLVVLSAFSSAQVVPNIQTDHLLFEGQRIDNDLQAAILTHLKNDPHFKDLKQEPQDTQYAGHILVMSDNTIESDWTSGQHARFLMEELRQGIFSLGKAKRTPIDDYILINANMIWPLIRDLACQDKHKVRYYDLNGAEQFCP